MSTIISQGIKKGKVFPPCPINDGSLGNKGSHPNLNRTYAASASGANISSFAFTLSDFCVFLDDSPWFPYTPSRNLVLPHQKANQPFLTHYLSRLGFLVLLRWKRYPISP